MDKKRMMKVHSALQNDHDQGVIEITMVIFTIYFWFLVIVGFSALIVLGFLFPEMLFSQLSRDLWARF